MKVIWTILNTVVYCELYRKMFVDLCPLSLHYLVFLCRYLASGSGDTTVRFWDLNTETPQFTCKGRIFVCVCACVHVCVHACVSVCVCLVCAYGDSDDGGHSSVVRVSKFRSKDHGFVVQYPGGTRWETVFLSPLRVNSCEDLFVPDLGPPTFVGTC